MPVPLIISCMEGTQGIISRDPGACYKGKFWGYQNEKLAELIITVSMILAILENGGIKTGGQDICVEHRRWCSR